MLRCMPFNQSYCYVEPAVETGVMRETVQYDEIADLAAGISHKASSVDLYSRLVNETHDRDAQDTLLELMENEQRMCWQLTNWYISMTGTAPVYHVESIPFSSYDEGLQIAYDRELNRYEEFSRVGGSGQHSQVYGVLLNANQGGWEHAKRLCAIGAGRSQRVVLKDYGPSPFSVNIEEATLENNTFRTALWTGNHLQVTLMSIKPGEDIGLEIHPDTDQFLRLEGGQGIVQMGDRPENLYYQQPVKDASAIMVPAGTWHNVINTGNTPIKLYSIYAPPHHARGTVHKTKADAEAAENQPRLPYSNGVWW